MNELPLFPLNTVLFPGMPLNLRIFEERYKLMINTCIEKRKPFGVVLISNKAADTSHRAEPHSVGCTAQITQVQPLGGGRMNITAVGKERFQILSLNHDKPYLVGITEPYPIIQDDTDTISQYAARLKYYVDNYLQILAEAGQVQFESKQLPHDPLSIGYLAAVLLQNIPSEQKQELLTVKHASALLQDLCNIYRRETALLQAMLDPPETDDNNGLFSLN